MLKTSRDEKISETVLASNTDVEYLFDSRDYYCEKWSKSKQRLNEKRKELKQSFFKVKKNHAKLCK